MTFDQAWVLHAYSEVILMSTERPEEFSEPPVSRGQQMSDDMGASETAGNHAPADDGSRYQATVAGRGESGRAPEIKSPPEDSSPKDVTVVVRGEALRDQDSKSPSKGSQAKDQEKSAPKKVSEAKVKMQSRLPALDDDPDVGVQKDQVVTRDGKADLAFTGTLLASAAPPAAPRGKWQEYRVYETSGGKHVFSKVSRSVYAEEQDEHKAEVFDPSPSSMPSQLLRGARDLVHSEPLTWKNAATDFFGYDPLAKALYRKLGDEFEEHIS
jgi:hypothetical protein